MTRAATDVRALEPDALEPAAIVGRPRLPDLAAGVAAAVRRPVRMRARTALNRGFVFGIAAQFEPVSAWGRPRACPNSWAGFHGFPLVRSLSAIVGILPGVEAGLAALEAGLQLVDVAVPVGVRAEVVVVDAQEDVVAAAVAHVAEPPSVQRRLDEARATSAQVLEGLAVIVRHLDASTPAMLTEPW